MYLFCGSLDIKFRLLFYQKKNYEFFYFFEHHFNSSNFNAVALKRACPTIKVKIIESHVVLILRKMEIFHQISFWNLSYWHNHVIFCFVNKSIEVDKLKDLFDFFTSSLNLNTHQKMEFLTSIEEVHLCNKYFQYFIILQILEGLALQEHFHSFFSILWLLFKFLCIALSNFLHTIERFAMKLFPHDLAGEFLRIKMWADFHNFLFFLWSVSYPYVK